MLQVHNEYDKLNRVLMASVANFRLHNPINSTQCYYYANDPPKLDVLIAQQNKYIEALQSNGVDIVFAEMREDSTNQINTRDVAFVIGNTFVVSPMKEPVRQNEHLALENLISTFESSDVVLRPQSGVIEGGDIVVAENCIYVGVSQRTNAEGVLWLKNNFEKKYKIVPIYLNDGYLHLDVVFNILSTGVCLLCEDGIKKESLQRLSQNHDFIYTHQSEQIYLPTNVLSINPKLLVADPRNVKTISHIANNGIDIIEIDFSEISKIGGSFRCSTCPLERTPL